MQLLGHYYVAIQLLTVTRQDIVHCCLVTMVSEWLLRCSGWLPSHFPVSVQLLGFCYFVLAFVKTLLCYYAVVNI